MQDLLAPPGSVALPTSDNVGHFRSTLGGDARALMLMEILKRGDDTQHYQPDKVVSMVAFVVNVKEGGEETVNCGEFDARFKDTHIELANGTTTAAEAKRRCRIVESTPRWREFVGRQNIDWSTSTFKAQLEGKCVRFTGYMFFDIEHDDEGENTTTGHPANWRDGVGDSPGCRDQGMRHSTITC